MPYQQKSEAARQKYNEEMRAFLAAGGVMHNARAKPKVKAKTQAEDKGNGNGQGQAADVDVSSMTAPKLPAEPHVLDGRRARNLLADSQGSTPERKRQTKGATHRKKPAAAARPAPREASGKLPAAGTSAKEAGAARVRGVGRKTTQKATDSENIFHKPICKRPARASPCQTPRQPLATARPPTKREGACTRKKVRAGCALPTASRALAGSFANPAGLRSRVKLHPELRLLQARNQPNFPLQTRSAYPHFGHARAARFCPTPLAIAERGL